jgi:hypothetical protein
MPAWWGTHRRSLLGSPLVVSSKGLELTRNRLMGHGWGSAEQRSVLFSKYCFSLRDLNVMELSRGSLAAGLRFGGRAANSSHFPGEL